MKNAILVDFKAPTNWEFHQGVEEATGEDWIIEKSVSNRNHGNAFQKAIRYAKYFLTPLKVAIHKNEYLKILAWQQFYGLILAFYFRLFNVKKTPPITVMMFIYKPKSNGRGVYERFIRYCVTSSYIHKLVVFSEREVPYYANLFGVSEEKFLAAKFSTADRTKQIPIGEKGNYFLSAGRSNRDYSFLMSVWNQYRKLKIIDDSLKEKAESSNIEILKDCHGDDYFRLLSNCYAVIIPLADTHISSGQLVILQAMMYGKPVIVTQNDTVGDYIVDGKDGIIIDKTKEALYNAISKLENLEYYNRMSVTERKHFEEKFSLYGTGFLAGKTFERMN